MKILQKHDSLGLLVLLFFCVILFSLLNPRFLSVSNFSSMAVQLPELGLLTFAMFFCMINGGLNLAVTFTANLAGIVIAATLLRFGGTEASFTVFLLASLAALFLSCVIGLLTGAIIAYLKAHPVLVSLAMMLFLRGVGEFFTRGKDISGFPEFVQQIGQGSFLGLPVPFYFFLVVAIFCFIFFNYSYLGLSVRFAGSNLEALRYAGVNSQKVICLTYIISSLIAGLAGVVMLARFNSVRVGHGESFLLITVLACFLGGVDPFGGFGKVRKVFLALIVLQILSSGLNLIGASQHLSMAIWGASLVAVIFTRWLTVFYKRKSS